MRLVAVILARAAMDFDLICFVLKIKEVRKNNFCQFWSK